eukprot:11664318-Karenia_brevis.AAC.1
MASKRLNKHLDEKFGWKLFFDSETGVRTTGFKEVGKLSANNQKAPITVEWKESQVRLLKIDKDAAKAVILERPRVVESSEQSSLSEVVCLKGWP